MKLIRLVLTAVFCFAFGAVSVQAAIRYWDTNSLAPGAGETPTGIWDVDTFWSTDAAGTNATTAWTAGDAAVFSAGTDATNAFTVAITDGVTVEASALTFEEGDTTITNGSILFTNEFEFPIMTLTNAHIASVLQDWWGTCGIKKTGPGTLILSGYNSYGPFGCTNTIAEGILVFSNTAALGSAPAFVIVSNGASLQFGSGAGADYTIALMGTGVSNSGALRYYHPNTPPSPYLWYGGAQLWSDALIVHAGGGQWRWDRDNIQGYVSNFNLTIGGNGGTLRLNMNQPYNVAVDLGQGILTKEGTFMLQFENPTRFSALHFNGGTIYPRNIGYLGSTTATPIIAGSAPGIQFTALFQGCGLSQPLTLTEGANVGFDCRLYNGNYLQFAYSGVISGPGSLYQTNPGSLLLNAANTYTGATTIKGGTLVLGANGSISNSTLIDLQNNATFVVSGVNGGFVLGPAQTLKGEGTVVGSMTAQGTLSPGAPIGSLIFDTNLTLTAGANLLIEVDKSVSPPNDRLTVVDTLSSTSTGTVTVVNLGTTPLATNDTFQISNQPVPGGQALTVVGAGATWNNRLAIDGSITVVSLVPATPPPTNLTIAAAGPNSIRLRAQGGASQPYTVLGYTNIARPLTDWWPLGTVYADVGGVIQFVDVLATNQHRFYRLATATAAPPKVPPSNLTISAVAPSGIALRATGGANLTYCVYATTDVTTPLASWPLVGNPVADGSGVIQFYDAPPANGHRFYRLGQ